MNKETFYDIVCQLKSGKEFTLKWLSENEKERFIEVVSGSGNYIFRTMDDKQMVRIEEIAAYSIMVEWVRDD